MWSRFQRPSRWALLVPALLGAWIAVRFWQAAADDPQSLSPESLVEGDYRVFAVIAGDELIVGPLAEDKAAPPAWQVRIGLIGIDCPTAGEPWSAEAKLHTQAALSAGQVHLRFDKRRRDRDGRLLAYASVGDRLVNEELLRAGLARLELPTGGVLILERQLQLAATEARSKKAGIWSDRP